MTEHSETLQYLQCYVPQFLLRGFHNDKEKCRQLANAIKRLEQKGYSVEDLILAAAMDKDVEPDRIEAARQTNAQWNGRWKKTLAKLRRLADLLDEAAELQRELKLPLSMLLEPMFGPAGSKSVGGKSMLIDCLEKLRETADQLKQTLHHRRKLTPAERSFILLFGYEEHIAPPIGPSTNASRTHLKRFLRQSKSACRKRFYSGFFEDVSTVYTAVADKINPEAIRKLSTRARSAA
jgi:hypothetical protein